MSRLPRERQLWLLIAAFAIGMAWVEAASVYYIRTLVDRIEPYQPNPLPVHDALGAVELVREAATLVMLLTAGMAAGRAWKKGLGYTALAFGVWDIFYYVFLRIICGWPRTIFDWDILFLLPLPWWGPVIAPVSIALLMIVWGTLVTQSEGRESETALPWTSWGAGGLGIALALYVFMADAIRALPQGPEAVRTVFPTAFNWPIFGVALALMAAPVAQIGSRLRLHGPGFRSDRANRVTAERI